jgi:GNAT superfamily N-acetyltransferase
MRELTTRPTGTPLQRWLARVPPQRGRETAPRPRGVRRRRARDLSTCTRLVRRAFFEGRFPGLHDEDPRSWLAGPDVFSAYVAERDGDVVGHVAISRVGLDTVSALRWREVTGRAPSQLAAVSRLFVRPRFRGQGIGASLVDVAVADIRSRGLVPVMEVTTEGRLPPSYSHGHGWRLRSTDPLPRIWAHHHEVWVHRHEGVPSH